MKASMSNILRLCIPFMIVSIILAATVFGAESSDPGDHWWSLDLERGILFVEADIPFYGEFEIDAAPWFSHAYDIKEVRISEGVERIGSYAFHFCVNLKTVTLPSTLRTIEEYAFYHCDSLEQINVSPNNPYMITDEQGALYNRDMTEILLCPKTFRGHFTIPGSVKKISSEAFCGCVYLTGVDIPQGLTTIEKDAFRDCIALKEVFLPHSLTYIGDSAFAACYSLRMVSVPDSVSSYGCEVFRNCDGMVRAFLPASLSDSEQTDFRGCLTLKELYFRGPAPALENEDSRIMIPEDVTLYYIEGQEGWTTSTWNGYETATWSGIAAIDVKDEDYFYDPVQWALSEGITNGVGDDLFCPENICTRGQVVTFLWRANGCPEPTVGENPFKDISPEAYYYKAVLWAFEEGITTGMDEATFAPQEGCTRGQVVTFLWRAKGKPDSADVKSPFTDVSEDAYYSKAVLLAVEQGITTGKTLDKFDPEDLCTRGQIVTFLWRSADSYHPYYILMKEKYHDVTGRGMLYDLDGNGTEELLLTYYDKGEHCLVYTIENGKAVPMLEDHVYAVPVGGGRARIGIAEIDGKLSVYTMSISYDMEHDEAYGAMDCWGMTWKFYVPSEEGLSLATNVSLSCYEAYHSDDSDWYPVYEKSVFTINGEQKPAETFEAWTTHINMISMFESGSGDGSSMEELMALCKP